MFSSITPVITWDRIYMYILFVQLTRHILCLYIIMKIIFLKIRKSIVNSLITLLYVNVCAVFLCTFTHSKRLRCVKIHSCTAWWSCGGSNATTWMGFWVILLLPQCTLIFWHSSEILLGLESLSLFSSLSNLCVWLEFVACREFFLKEKTAYISNTSVQ